MRQQDAVVLVEGYMDAIAVARAGVSNVIASCGTSLTEAQVKLLSRFTRRVIVNYDPDTAGQAATERSLTILLEQNCDARVLALPGGKDPDSFIRSEGAAVYNKLLQTAPPYLDYLIGRAQRLGIGNAEEKLRAINFLLPYVQRIPNSILRSEWASRISQQLRVDQPVLREALRQAATERHGQVKQHMALAARPGQPAERRLIKFLMESDGLRARLVEDLRRDQLHLGLETEKIIASLIDACAAGNAPDVAVLAQGLEDRDRRLLLEIAFESSPESATWEEAASCLDVLRRRLLKEELAALQRQIEAHPASGVGQPEALRELLARKQELRQRLA
jgi:DNA primase